MYLKSVFLKGDSVSVVSFVRRVDNNSLIPFDVWRSTINDFNYVAAAKDDVSSTCPAIVLVNPDLHSPVEKPTSGLKRAIDREKASGLRVLVSSKFETAQGLAALQFVRQDDKMNLDLFPEWRKIKAELNRLEQNQSTSALAFLQACIYADEEIGKEGVGFGMRLGGHQGRRR